jgi:hypothetical protein
MVIGLAICKLIENLSGKIIGVANRNGKTKSEMVEAITQCLVFLEREGAAISCISPTQIQAGSIRDSFKLIWAIICKYEIEILAPCVGMCRSNPNPKPQHTHTPHLQCDIVTRRCDCCHSCPGNTSKNSTTCL